MPRRQFVMAALAAATVMTGVSLAPPVRTATHEYVIADPEAYDVYATILQAHREAGPSRAGEYVIRRETFTLQTGCAATGQPSDPAWRPALADYVAVNAVPHALVEGYAFELPYTLVAEAELREAKAPGTVEWHAFNARHAAADGYFTFSAVGFSPDRAMAVVYVEHFCTPLCGSGRVEFLRKRHGRWRAAEVRGVRTCGWIS